MENEEAGKMTCQEVVCKKINIMNQSKVVSLERMMIRLKMLIRD